MISLNELTAEELLALKEQAQREMATITREQINLQFRLNSSFDRQISAQERVNAASMEVDSYTTLVTALQNNGASPTQLNEYQNKLDLATLRLKIAQANQARYSNVSLVQLQKEVSQLAEKEASFQNWISEIDQLING